MSSYFGLVPILAAVVTIQLLLRSVSSLNLTNEYLHHECINSLGKYKKGSQFEEKLNRVVRLHSSGNLRDGFADASSGNGPNDAYVRLQCRADSYWSKCHSCLATAFSGLRRRCPGNKGAIIWYDQCLLRISTIHGYGKVDVTNKFYLSNPNKVRGNPAMFNKETSAFLEKLTSKAADFNNVMDDESLVLYAAGDKMIGTNKLYAMVQCTKDLVFKTCFECLQLILKEFPKCCDGKIGGRVLSLSCNFSDEAAPVAAAAAIPEDMDLMTASELTLRKSRAHGRVTRGPLGNHVLKLVKALCAHHNINFLNAPSANALGECAGVCLYISSCR